MNNINYFDMKNWLSFGGDKNADVFFIYPTVTYSDDKLDKPFIQIDNDLMHTLANDFLLNCRGLFSNVANIYAPFYRHLNGTMLKNFTNSQFASYTNSTPRNDIFSAFNYYLENVNKGERPFIIFGHSQGGQLAIELATTFLGSEKYIKHNKNHIITYAIGYSVIPEQIAKNPNLQFSQSKNDTGVIVSWNSIAPSEVKSKAYTSFGNLQEGALVTNPISWQTNKKHIKASENYASKVENPDSSYTMVENYADAQVDKNKGILLVTTVNESNYSSILPVIGKFHRSDINFYYQSIKNNISDRINAFKLKA
jgi:hypothetical protein